MSSDTQTLPAPIRKARGKERTAQWGVVLALVATVVVLDQSTKWWAWRHVTAIVNTGGDSLVGSTVGGWYEGTMTGPMLDLLDLGVVILAASVLMRRPRPALVLASGALMVGGWGSNLLDRLMMHHLTAPGSGHGAVDFIHIGHSYFNLADFTIVASTPLFLLAVAGLGWGATRGPATVGAVTCARRRGRHMGARAAALAGAVCCMAIVAVGVAGLST